VGPEIARVLRKALATMHGSGDAFDPGMHDLKQLWGIGTDRGHVPSTDSVKMFLVRRYGFLPGPGDTLPEPFAVLPDDRVVLRPTASPSTSAASRRDTRSIASRICWTRSDGPRTWSRGEGRSWSTAASPPVLGTWA